MLKQKAVTTIALALACSGFTEHVDADQTSLDRSINEYSVKHPVGNNSNFTKSRARTLEKLYLRPNGAGKSTANLFARPDMQSNVTAETLVHNYDFARPYLQELNAPYTDQTGIEALQSKDTREQCATVVHWNADANNMNAFTAAVVNDNPDAVPQAYSNAYVSYVDLNCNW